MSTNDHKLESAPLFILIDGKLERVSATKQEILLGNALGVYLRRVVSQFAKSGREVATETKLLGKMWYREHTVGRGARRHTQHFVSFKDEDYVFHYEEMRHALQIAIYGMTGEAVSLSIDFEQKTAWWRFLAGSKLSDVVR